MYKIYLVEDDYSIREKMEKNLSGWDYEICLSNDFREIEKEFTELSPDLVILDINLPHYDGFYWCKKIRKLSKVPIMMVSARDSDMDQIMAMNLGADDYMTKPFYMELFITKVKALLRRNYAYSDEKLNIINYKDLMLLVGKHQLKKDDKVIDLTKNEFIILEILFNNPNKIITRSELMNGLWNSDSFIDDNTLSVNVNRLRSKIKEIEVNDLLLTKKGIGYYLNEDY